MPVLTVAPGALDDTDVCPCCGHRSRVVRGRVHADGAAHAAYAAHWTLDHVAEHGVHLNIVLGDWGAGTTADDRVLVRLSYRLAPRPGIMVVDAAPHLAAMRDLAARGLSRAEVIGTPLADEVFAVCDTILLQDPRVSISVLTG